MKQKFSVKVNNIAGWPDQGMVYIDDGTVPAGVYSFEKGEPKGDEPTPVYIKEYKNRVRLSKKTLKKITDNL